MQNNLLGLALLTYAVEYVVYAAVLWRLGRNSWAQIALFVLLINGLTWPVATIMFHNYSISMVLIELAVFLVEAIIIRFWWQMSWTYALLLSTLANVASYYLGLLCYS